MTIDEKTKGNIFWTFSLLMAMAGISFLPLMEVRKDTKTYHQQMEYFRAGEQRIEATVLSRLYENKLKHVPEKYINWGISQAFSNETVTLESSLRYKIRTDNERIMGLSVIDGESEKKEALDLLILTEEEVGPKEASRISFPVGNLKEPTSGLITQLYNKETYINPNTQVATKMADRITVLPQ